MKTNQSKLKAQFGPETAFEINPVLGQPFRATLETQFESLKRRLLLKQLNVLEDKALNSQIRRAANEAANLASGTCYPLLLFPELFQEKIDVALGLNVSSDPTAFIPEYVEAC